MSARLFMAAFYKSIFAPFLCFRYSTVTVVYSENFSELSFLNSYDHGGSESYVSSDCVRMNAVWARKDDGSFFFRIFNCLHLTSYWMIYPKHQWSG